MNKEKNKPPHGIFMEFRQKLHENSCTKNVLIYTIFQHEISCGNTRIFMYSVSCGFSTAAVFSGRQRQRSASATTDTGTDQHRQARTGTDQQRPARTGSDGTDQKRPDGPVRTEPHGIL